MSHDIETVTHASLVLHQEKKERIIAVLWGTEAEAELIRIIYIQIWI